LSDQATVDNLAAFYDELHGYELLRNRELQSRRGGLIHFVRYFWPVLEPTTPFVEGWAMEAICRHLESTAYGEIKRLLITVPPGFAKSLLTDVFFPAWLWSAFGMPDTRIVAFSYAASLTERDNGKFRDLLMSDRFREMWADKFELRKIGETKVSNDKTGWKLASSVSGVGTGERGHFVILDDPHSIKEAESEVVRTETVRWFREAMSNRLNDMAEDVIIVIMQRSHESDVAGAILDHDMGYCTLCVDMEFDTGRQTAFVANDIGWIDPRRYDGELAWPERFPQSVCDNLRRDLGPYAWAAQYQQIPSPRQGGIIQRAWWLEWGDEIARRYGLEWHGGRKEFPEMDLIAASLDTAFKEKEENDFNAMTVWGVWNDQAGNRRAMLMFAWNVRKPLHGIVCVQEAGESDIMFKERQKANWGLIELIADTCKRYRVQRLLIEDSSRGHDVAQEINRLYARERWGVELVRPAGDKVTRGHAIVPLFTDGVVWAPDTRWAEMVMTQCSQVPKAAHDDMYDTVTQFLHWARVNGILERADETTAAIEEDMKYQPKKQSVAEQYGV
jgi:predicted phage terminase large subunit-like protein